MTIARPILAAALLAVAAVPARAELPPQYTAWAEYAVVAVQTAIPKTLGVVDRIERTGPGRFIARAGSCYVEISITRKPAAGPKGEPVAGPSQITGATVGEKKCN